MRDDRTNEILASAKKRAAAMDAVLGGTGSSRDVSGFSGTKGVSSGRHDLRDQRESLQQEQGKKEWGFDKFGNMIHQEAPLTRADVMAMMPDLIRRDMPQPLKGLLETTLEVGIDPLEMVATMQTNGSAAWTKGVGGSLNVYGDVALYKAILLRGWSKADADADWVAMTIEEEETNTPTKMDTDFVDGIDLYPWYALRPTWDYVRAV